MDNLQDNPKWVSFAIDEAINVVFFNADDNDLCRAIRHAKGSLKLSREEEVDSKYSETSKKFSALQTKVWEAWLELLEFQKEHCYIDPDSDEAVYGSDSEAEEK